MMAWASVPCCDTCWPIVSRKLHRMYVDPHRLPENVRARERCHYCDAITRSGIYVRDWVGVDERGRS